MRLQDNLAFVNLEQAGRALMLAFFANIPIALWGAPGIGKSSKVYQIAAVLGLRMYDFRLSDKDKSDIGGIPFPVKTVRVKAEAGVPMPTTVEEVEHYIEYLIAKGLLPFDSDEWCILFLDEFDRTDDPGVRNAIQQVILDRRVNNHVLSPNCRIVLAGNGTSDIDTTPPSKAANGRMCHLYVENESKGAFDSWMEWATTEVPIDPADLSAGTRTNVSPLLINFAKFNIDVWRGNGHRDAQGNEKTTEFLEQAEISNRTWEYADRFVRAADDPEHGDYPTDDILEAVVAGCIGLVGAKPFLEFKEHFDNAPLIDEIVADPDHAMVPNRIDILSTLVYTLSDYAKGRDHATADAIGRYGLRWTVGDAQSFLMRRLIDKCPTFASTDAYSEWTGHRGIKTKATYKNWLPDLAVIFTDGKPLPENDGWINRLSIPSRSNPDGKPYILSQEENSKFWQCSCPGWTLGRKRNRTCDHIKRVPIHMKEPNDPSLTAVNA